MARHFGATRYDGVGAGNKLGAIVCDADFRKWLLCLVGSQGCVQESLNLKTISRYSESGSSFILIIQNRLMPAWCSQMLSHALVLLALTFYKGSELSE